MLKKMIAVIADDITGAAELAGIGLNYQLKTEVNTVVADATDADLLIINADTRSLTAEEAKQITRQIAVQVAKLKPQLVYKKIDSVLRGHILAEIEAQLETDGNMQRALIIPGNPSHRKTVVDGIYYYQEAPVHRSSFAHDPAFPISASHVHHLLRADENVQVLAQKALLPPEGIFVGDVTGPDDLAHWVDQLDKNTLVAGAAELFDQLLQKTTGKQAHPDTKPAELQWPRLYVFGSTFYQDRLEMINGRFKNIPLTHLPAQALTATGKYLPDDYVNHVSALLKNEGGAIIGISTQGINVKIDPVQLAQNMGNIVNKVTAQAHPAELVIEGGATAAAILMQMGITRLYPEQQLAPGVMRMRVPGNNQLYITVKPGSYAWPEPVWA